MIRGNGRKPDELAGGDRGACWALLLGAGEGRRFGSGKLLASLGGRPLVGHVLAAIDLARLQGSLAGGIAVLPPEGGELRELVERAELLAVENPDPGAGLAGSLKLGLAALERPELVPRPEAAAILLGDQPLVRARVIGELVGAWQASGAMFVRPRYAAAPGEPGHPVVVDRSAWPLAEGLEGEAGLGSLLAEHPQWVEVVEVSGGNPDVDAPADLEALEKRL